jgi:hypothetical protein
MDLKCYMSIALCPAWEKPAIVRSGAKLYRRPAFAFSPEEVVKLKDAANAAQGLEILIGDEY